MIVFVTMIAILVGMLELLNWIPSAIQEGAFQRFRTVEEVRERLMIDPIYMPAYFPGSVQWPPSLIAAQTRPFPAVVMEYSRRDAPDDTILITLQTAIGRTPPRVKFNLLTIRQTAQFTFKGRKALLEVGTCKGADRCSRMSWREGNDRIMLIMKSAPSDLTGIAESMIPEHGSGRAGRSSGGPLP